MGNNKLCYYLFKIIVFKLCNDNNAMLNDSNKFLFKSKTYALVKHYYSRSWHYL